MNRYAVEGITRDLRAGRRVLVACHTRAEARAVFDALRASDELSSTVGVRILQSNGRERIEHPSGGRCTFGSAATGGVLRGRSVDTLVCAPDVYQAHREDIEACVAASLTGEIIVTE